MKRIVCLVLLLCLLLTGCALPVELPEQLPWQREEEPVNAVDVYRLCTDGEGGALVRPEACELGPEERADMETVLKLFLSRSRESGLTCAVPEGVYLESWSLDGSLAALRFSLSALELTDMEQTAMAFAAALTLCALDEVDAVTVLAGEETLFRRLAAEDALLEDTDSDPFSRRLKLYFADEQKQYLVSEYRSLSLDEDSSLERYVVEELLRGPNSAELRAVIPEGTKLLSCTTEDGICTVDLSGEFMVGKPAGALEERLVIYSIVNSLGALAEVEAVQILCQGQALDGYVYRSLAEPLESYMNVLGPAETAAGETDVLLYRALPGLEALAAMPCVLNLSAYDSPELAVATALLETEEPGYPSVFFGMSTIRSITREGRSCTVDVAESFFASLSPDERSAAVGSLAASLCELEDIVMVRFTMEGSDAVFEGVSYEGPWAKNHINIVE